VLFIAGLIGILVALGVVYLWPRLSQLAGRRSARAQA
jgi:hypothetical protein